MRAVRETRVELTATESALETPPAVPVRMVASVRLLPALAVIGALWWARALLIPMVLAVLASYALEPAVSRLELWRIRRVVGVPLLLAAIAVVGAMGVYGLRGEAVAFADRLPGAAHAVAEAVRARTAGRPGPVAKMQQAASELERAAAATARETRVDGVTQVRVQEPTFKWNSLLWQGSSSAFELGSQLFFVVCLIYSLLVAGDLYKRKIVRIMGPSIASRKTTVQILAEIERQIERFLWARVFISTMVGLAVWLSFRFLGLDEPGVWGVLSALLFTIPLIGPTLVVLGAGLAGFIQFQSIGMAASAGGVCLAITAIEAYLLSPLLMSRVGEMNAVAVFASLMFWGWLWGIWGLLLAVPITAALKAVCERVDGWNEVADLLKG